MEPAYELSPTKRRRLALFMGLIMISATIQAIGCNRSLERKQEVAMRADDSWQRLLTCQMVSDNETCPLSDACATSGAPHVKQQRQQQQQQQQPKADGDLSSRMPLLKRIWFKIMDESNRGAEAWRFLYIDELLGPFKPLVLDRSADERHANMIYTVSLAWLGDMSFFKFNSGSAKQDQLNEIRAAGRKVSASQCARDLREMAAQMEELRGRLAQLRRTNGSDKTPAIGLESRHLRLARVLDSFGRYESASLTGHFRLIGGYSECAESTLEPQWRGPAINDGNGDGDGDSDDHDHSNLIEMRYCWAKMNLESRLRARLRRRPRLEHETSDVQLQVGACLPRSCHTRTLREHKQLVQRFVDSQLELPATIYVSRRLELESVFCLADKDGEFGMPTSGLLCLIFGLLWLALCYAATLKRAGESSQPEQEGQREGANDCSRRTRVLLAHFNLRKSWTDFTSDKRQLGPEARVELDVLNPIKVVACAFVVFAHTNLWLGAMSGRPLEVAATCERDNISMAAFMLSVVVDTSFVISGLLLTFITLKKLHAGFGFGFRQQKGQSKLALDELQSCWSLTGLGKELAHFLANWLILAANRYLRLVPLYALMFWFRRDVLTYLGSGPLWDFGFNRNTMNGACSQESWLVPLSPLSAFMQLNKQCYVPSWSISNDILFGLLVPPIILLLAKRPKFAFQLVSLLVANSVVKSLRSYTEATPENRWELGDSRIHGTALLVNGLSHLYTSPLYRLSSYLMGTLAGYALFQYDQKALTKDGRWPKWVRERATSCSIFYIVAHLLVGSQTRTLKTIVRPYHHLFAAFFTTLDRPLWAASNAMVFLRMMTDWRQSDRMRAWAGQGWRTLARLNFAMLFTHWLLVVLQDGILTSLPTHSLWQVWTSFAGVYLLALAAALVVHLAFENPIDSLIKHELFGL